MKTIAVIPARYNSSRFKGKPLADICGKPMIWWVYSQVKKVEKISEVYVATDSTEIAGVCDRFGITYIMTADTHTTSTERLYEVAQKIHADVYVCINGDEPLIDPFTVARIIPDDAQDFFAANLFTKISNPVEVVDNTNIKVVMDHGGNALFMSRSPIPHPKAAINYDYYKHLGVLAYTFDALEFFADTPKGENEKIEDINELRFIEHGKKLSMIPVDAHTLSVDTPKDLEYVKRIIESRIAKEKEDKMYE